MKGSTGKIIKTAFIAMIVLTASMIAATVVNISKLEGNMALSGKEILIQKDTLEGRIADDATVAVISTSLGDMAAELYPQCAPETVANFRKLADSGYYKETFVYSVNHGLNAGLGSKFSDGTFPKEYDESIEKTEPEITKDLWPLKGALLSAGLTQGTLWRGQITYSGSRFIIPGSIDFEEEDTKKTLDSYLNLSDEDKQSNPEAFEVTQNLIDMFRKYGGTPNVSQQITVFGQIFDGWDVLDSILNVPVDENKLCPLSEIEITDVKVMTYSEYTKNQAKPAK
ncbi:peptidylprolyl isomerase [Ruminococcus sp. HUN007]|uniref:peptidylprolyl isomerase n=1 Tax=Ruminococcus sp. HUN007 TaxID=1514668 RepID=UPI000678FD2A|nr:peptidylprolyl isomerase [Ruminococcus sp. HUN007]